MNTLLTFNPDCLASTILFLPLNIYFLYLGTLFRLPLRTSAQAEHSLLSKRALSISEARNLLEALRQEASAMLLFLKNVESIEICQWNVGESEKEILFSCNILNISLELRNKRAFVGTSSLSNNLKSGICDSRSISAVDYSLKIKCACTQKATDNRNCEAGQINDKSGIGNQNQIQNAHHNDNNDNIDNFKHEDSTTEKEETVTKWINEYVECWEVCNQLGGEFSSKIADDPTNVLLRLIPWGGTAVCLNILPADVISSGSGSPSFPTSQTMERKKSGTITSRAGLAYCFLPLPISTDLPIMLNGFFELSSNRRDIWQSGQGGSAGGEMTGDGRTRAEWNLSLMRDVISPSYVRLLLRVRDILGYTEIFQNLFPSEVSAPWSVIVESTLARCACEKLLYVGPLSPPSIELLSPSLSLKSSSPPLPLPLPLLLDQSTLSFTSTNTAIKKNDVIVNSFSGSWISCRDAVLLPDFTVLHICQKYKNLKALSSDQEQRLRIFLLESGQPFVNCSPKLNKSLSQYKTCTILAFPEYVRKVLRGEPTYVPTADMCSSFLLQYCLSDLIPSSLSDCTELNSLPLLPLLSGLVGTIKIFSQPHAVCVGELCSMGYSFPKSVWALSNSSFDIFQACDLLSSTTSKEIHEIESMSTYNSTYGVYVIASSDVADVFSGAGNMLIDCASLSYAVSDFLQHENIQKQSNLRLFQPSLLPDLLKLILPSVCNGGASVSVGTFPPHGCSLQGPRTADSVINQENYDLLLRFLPKFWTFVRNQDDYISAIAEGSAIVPSLSLPLSRTLPFLVPLTSSTYTVAANESINSIDGGSKSSSVSVNVSTSLHDIADNNSVNTINNDINTDHTVIHLSPLSRMSSLLATRKGDLTLPTIISIILQDLGLKLIDFSLLPVTDGVVARTFWEYVHAPNRSGLLVALDAVLRNNDLKNFNHEETIGMARSNSEISLTSEQRELFRLYLSSCEPVDSLTGEY